MSSNLIRGTNQKKKDMKFEDYFKSKFPFLKESQESHTIDIDSDTLIYLVQDFIDKERKREDQSKAFE